MNKINIYKSLQELAQKFGDYLVEITSGSKTKNIALCGGSTPKILFDYLAEKYPAANIWRNIHLYWGDERCVAPDNDDSNFKITKERLLDKIKIAEKNIHRILGEANPALEAVRYGNEINKGLPTQNRLPSFDLVILGIGDDGHTASIFAHQMEFLDSQNICEVSEHPVSGQKRITLSGRVINNSKEVAFLVSGKNKKEIVSEILNQTGNWKTYPASFIKPVDGNVKWFLDESAAKNYKRQ